MKTDFQDKEIFELIKAEEERQRSQLQMIPSENVVSEEVMAAVGSVLMNKYSEGQPFKRYYQGNVNIDKIESLVKKRALKAYGLDESEWGVNVQAIGGSGANLAVYNALFNYGDKILSMSLYDGGHLSHGWQMADGKKISFSSKFLDPYFYYVDSTTGVFDYDQIEEVAMKVMPKLLTSGGTAYPREINHKRMREIADKVGALYMADIAHEAGLVLAGVNSSPFAYAHVVTMTTRKTLRGPIGAMIFSRSEYSDLIDKSVFPGLQGGPQNHSIAGIGVALFEAMKPEFTEYAGQVVKNAQVLAQELMKRGLTLVSGGTDKHLFLIDLRPLGLKFQDESSGGGNEIALALEKANIICNKNTIPGDTGKPWKPSGIRMGTPAITTRGFKEGDMVQIAEWIDRVIRNYSDEAVLAEVGREVEERVKK